MTIKSLYSNIAPPKVIDMEPNIPALVDMTFEKIVHIISPPQKISFWPFPQLYSYQLARFALDNWYDTTKSYILCKEDTAMSSACRSLFGSVRTDTEKKENPYERKLDEKYAMYSNYLEKLHDSMLIV